MTSLPDIQSLIASYRRDLSRALEMEAMAVVPVLAEALRECWARGNTVYLCGNGGSAGNAIHLANDLLYCAGASHGGGLKVEALSANPAVLTCLANDLGYDQIRSSCWSPAAS
jgi:D-sedoheptulose 7-phosphate isomerase